MKSYIVASTKDWNKSQFLSAKKTFPGEWSLVTSPEELDQVLSRTKPEYVFFLHWGWHVPKRITSNYDSICFHMTDLPFGRGGSPLQNLITRGYGETLVSASRMVDELDAGPIYTKQAVSLEGRAEEIYHRVGRVCFQLIERIIREKLRPIAQEGEVVIFSRRSPAQSVLPDTGDLLDLYDHIRMLDAPTYPRSFIEYGDFVLEFHHAVLSEDNLEAQVSIRRRLSADENNE